jgi:uncharacterized protein YbjT (DUF2867 family)
MNTTQNRTLSGTIVVAGASGDLGERICKHLIARGAIVRGLVRKDRNQPNRHDLIKAGVELIAVDFGDSASLTQACRGADCVVSALSGLRDVIVDVQINLAKSAINAGVPRFIPSDYCIDYRNIKPGTNRNLDFRRECASLLYKMEIQSTSILNGMFTDLLRGQAPVILKDKQRIFFWGNADQEMDFTTIENTAEFTAEAALDPTTPRWLTIAGDVASMRDIKEVATNVFNKPFQFLRPGGLTLFKVMIRLTKTFAPGKKEIFPAWQGMQYLYDMLTGIPKFEKLDNSRYKSVKWSSIAEVINQK